MYPHVACLHEETDPKIKSHWRWMLNVKDIVMTDRMMLNSSLQPSHPGYDHAYDGGMIKRLGCFGCATLAHSQRAASTELKSSFRVWNQQKPFHTLHVGFCFPASNCSLLGYIPSFIWFLSLKSHMDCLSLWSHHHFV